MAISAISFNPKCQNDCSCLQYSYCCGLGRNQRKLDIPVLGVILPGASAAIKASQHGTIGIIGTPMTIQSDIYRQKIERLLPEVEVTSLSCPKFVPLVESNELSSSITKKWSMRA